MINLVSTIGSCYDFISEEKKERVTIALAPIVVRDNKEGKTNISWACSRGLACENHTCVYSHKEKRNGKYSEPTIRDDVV